MNDEPITWGPAASTAVRKLAIVTLAGALSGLVVGGIGGRLAMFLLAQLNPEATGVRSDDDFVIGQFTLSGTLNLLAIATAFGVIGGAIYLAVRGLRLGPSWFRYASVAAGAGVVVGAPQPGEERWSLRQDPHLQLQGEPRHRSPHRDDGALPRPGPRRSARRPHRRAHR